MVVPKQWRVLSLGIKRKTPYWWCQNGMFQGDGWCQNGSSQNDICHNGICQNLVGRLGPRQQRRGLRTWCGGLHCRCRVRYSPVQYCRRSCARYGRRCPGKPSLWRKACTLSASWRPLLTTPNSSDLFVIVLLIPIHLVILCLILQQGMMLEYYYLSLLEYYTVFMFLFLMLCNYYCGGRRQASLLTCL